MEKKMILWTIISLILLLVLPLMIFLNGFENDQAGLMGFALLVFVIDPIYFIVTGIFAGKKLPSLWGLPFISACLFVLSAQNIQMTAFYLVLGVFSMLLSGFAQWSEQS